jgi:signal transduction histidine kinase
MVGLGLVRSAFSDGLAGSEVVLAVVLLGWYVVGTIETACRSASVTYMWLAGLSLLCLAAVWISPDFAWVSFAVFVTYANALRPVAAIGAIGALAVGTGGLLVGRWPHDGHWASQVVGPLVGAAVAGTLVGISRLAAAETAERQRLLDELLATRDDLARAHLNAGVRVERERLAREIHDTLAQGFTSVVLAARRARHAAQKADQTVTFAEIDQVENLGREGVEDARRLVDQLPPAELDDRPLPAALDLLSGRDPAGAEPLVEVRVDGDSRRLPTDVDVALLRVAQEAVANARHHADADRIVVTLTYQPTAVRLDIADDGKGFDPSQRRSRGFGLSSMRSRIEQLGGTLTVESTPGQGVVVNAAVPLTRADVGGTA